MPIFVPIIAAGAVGKAVMDMYQSDKIESQANDKNLKSMNRMAEANIQQSRKIEEARTALIRLANRKKAIISTSMSSFLDLYKQIVKINFTSNDTFMQLDETSLSEIESINCSVYVSKELMSDAEAIVNTAVWGFASAVSMMMVANPLLAIPVLTASVKKDSEKTMNSARVFSRKASVVEEQSRTVSLAHEAITERAKRITKVITDLNVLFLKSISHTWKIIDKNGMNKQDYTLNDREALAACMNMAFTIKKLLDTPLLDQDGQITMKSLEAIQMGEKYLQEIDLVLIQ